MERTLNGTGPLIAVLIPVYGESGGLETTLQSLRQVRQPARFCTIVVDDGSEPPVMLDAARFAPLDLRLARLPRNAGIEHALNRGLQLARELGVGYVARLDAGDTLSPERLQKQSAYLEGHPDVGIVASDALFVDDGGRTLFRFEAPRTDRDVRRRMHVNSCLPHPTVMMRMDILKEAEPYSSDYPAAEDYELFWRLLARTRAASLPEPLTTVTVSASGISTLRRRAQLRSRWRLQWRHFNLWRPESYAGVLLTLLFLLVPGRLVEGMKRRAGVVRY